MQFMRAGPLSDDRVIAILNHYYVPVSFSNDEVTRRNLPDGELREKTRIVRESWNIARKTGEDAVYVLSPNGRVIDTIRAPDSIHTEPLLKFLREHAEGYAEGPVLVAPRRRSKLPQTETGDLILHLTARYLPSGDGWAKIPAENWILLKSNECGKLLAPTGAKPGDQWAVDTAVATKLLANFYPPTGNTDLSKNKIEKLELQATLVSVNGDLARVRLDGKLKMKHPFFTTGFGVAGKIQDKDASYYVVVDAITGYVDYGVKDRQIKTLRAVGDKATYDNGNFGVALRSYHPDIPALQGVKAK